MFKWEYVHSTVLLRPESVLPSEELLSMIERARGISEGVA